MSSDVFVKMIEAYRSTLGTAFPRRDIAAVVKVFRECAKDQALTQDGIGQTTGLPASTLSKIVKRACENGWTRTSRRADRTKNVSLTAKNRKTLEDFESRCAEACSESAATIQAAKATRAAGKTSSRRRSEKAATGSADLWTAVGMRPDGTKAVDE